MEVKVSDHININNLLLVCIKVFGRDERGEEEAGPVRTVVRVTDPDIGKQA